MAERPPYIAPDGWYFLVPVMAGLGLAVSLGWFAPTLVLLVLLVVLVLLFRDPPRAIVAGPKSVVSPVDGRVVEVSRVELDVMGGPAWCVCIAVNNLGAYAARSPIEGRVMDLRHLPEPQAGGGSLRRVGGLWVHDDSGHDVVVVLHAMPLLGRPRALVRYGERVGQGQRCAWLRVAREAEVYISCSARLAVKRGDRVHAGSTALAEFPRRA